jgi:hypothetical protein
MSHRFTPSSVTQDRRLFRRLAFSTGLLFIIGSILVTGIFLIGTGQPEGSLSARLHGSPMNTPIQFFPIGNEAGTPTQHPPAPGCLAQPGAPASPAGPNVGSTPPSGQAPAASSPHPCGPLQQASAPPAQPSAPPATGPMGQTACQEESPYGMTTIHADHQLTQEFGQLGICWVRLQMNATDIEPAPGVFTWTQLDLAVSQMNAAGIHIDFPLRCFSANSFNAPKLPMPEQMAAYASALASRYDGQHGHGTIDAFEILNEEADFEAPGDYGPLLQAGYQAIKAANPTARVGMYGTYRPNIAHVQAVMSAIANGYSQDLDFANFHYYAHGLDPATSDAEHPSLQEVIQTMHQILPGKPIWITEVGWPTSPLPGIQAVSPQTQAQFLQEVMETARQSGVVERVFWFTLDYGNQPDSIFPPGGPLPAFFTYQQEVAQHPSWQTDPTLSPQP